jgi:hypothetical protein
MRFQATRWLAALIMIGSATGARAASGDVNGDGFITAADVRLALQYAGGLATPTFARASTADVAADGSVTIADAVRIARIATRVDALPPSLSLPAPAVALTVSGNTVRNVALPGGYAVSGRVLDRLGKVFEGGVTFRDANKVFWGPAPLDEVGDYTAALPPGTYQAIVLTHRTDATSGGEDSVSDTAIAAGAPFNVSQNLTAKNLTRPDIAATSRVTFDFSGPSRPFLTEARIFLTDTGANPATFGLNVVGASILSTPADRAVPPGTYYVDTRSSVSLSSGFTEDLYLAFAQTISVPAVTSRTLAFPTTYQLGGDLTGASGPDAFDILAKQAPKAGANIAMAHAATPQEQYLLELPAGTYTISVGAATLFQDTAAEFLFPYTMPAKNTSRDISLPAQPVFRTVSGTVVGADGLPAVGARVQVDSVVGTIPAAGVYAFHADTLTDDLGAYAIGLPNGNYTLTVTPA